MKLQYLVTIVLLLSTIYFAFKYFQEAELNKDLTTSKNFQLDWDPSGEILVSKWINNNELSSSYIDKNFDYNYEVTNAYDIYGNLYQTCFDQNENGVFEKTICYDAYGKKIGSSIDKNEDGVPDEMTVSLENNNQLNLIDINHDGIWEEIIIINDKTKSKIRIEDLLK